MVGCHFGKMTPLLTTCVGFNSCCLSLKLSELDLVKASYCRVQHWGCQYVAFVVMFRWEA